MTILSSGRDSELTPQGLRGHQWLWMPVRLRVLAQMTLSFGHHSALACLPRSAPGGKTARWKVYTVFPDAHQDLPISVILPCEFRTRGITPMTIPPLQRRLLPRDRYPLQGVLRHLQPGDGGRRV